MAALASDWPRHLPKSLNGIQRNLTESKILMSSTKFVFFGPIGRSRWPPWSLVGRYIFDSSYERNSMKLDMKQDLVLYHVWVFLADKKNRMAAPASDWQRHFVFFSETAKQNSTKLYRNQDPNVLYQVCFSGQSEKQRWSSRPTIDRNIFDFSFETAEQNKN